MIFSLVCGLIGLVIGFLILWPVIVFIWVAGSEVVEEVICFRERRRQEQRQKAWAEQGAERGRAARARAQPAARNGAEKAIATLQRFDDGLVGKIHELRVKETSLRNSIKNTLGDDHGF